LTDEALPGILTISRTSSVKIPGRTSSFLYIHDSQNTWQNFIISVLTLLSKYLAELHHYEVLPGIFTIMFMQK
jgi:hypothetical protein